jgi:hypothetical protein
LEKVLKQVEAAKVLSLTNLTYSDDWSILSSKLMERSEKTAIGKAINQGKACQACLTMFTRIASLLAVYREIAKLRCYSSLRHIPEPVDFAWIEIPRQFFFEAFS